MQTGFFMPYFKSMKEFHSYNGVIFLIGERRSLILDGCFETDCRNFLVSYMDWCKTNISENRKNHFSVFQASIVVFQEIFYKYHK